MKAIITFCCLALLPPIIFGGSESEDVSDSDIFGYSTDSTDDFEEVALNEAQAKIDKVLQNNGIINDVFEPTQFLGRGAFCVTYKGELLRDGSTMTVAVKFSPTLMWDTLDEDNEYDMYTYMKAIDNSTVENYGIPAVYYYGKWEKCSMIAITLLDSTFHELFKVSQLKIDDIDILIIFRDYVRLSKYMHASGICHEDTKLENFMFKNNRCFIIDFNISHKVHESQCKIDCRKDDWKFFFLTMVDSLRFKVDWHKHINNVQTVAAFKHPGLRRVFVEFANNVFKDDPINYNGMDEIITEELYERGVQEPATVSWLTDAQTNMAKMIPSPDIRSINEPPMIMTEQFLYPEPNYDFFANHH